jgi:hypothetical protein
MKTLSHLLALFLAFNIGLVSAQENDLPEFSLAISSGIGNSTIDNKRDYDYSLFCTNGELLLTYRFHNNWGIASGIGYTTLSGNAFNSIGHFYQYRDLIRIPLLVTLIYENESKYKLIAGAGLYGYNILNAQYRFGYDIAMLDVEGWNYGFQGELTFAFEIDEKFNIGINYKQMMDLGMLDVKLDNGKSLESEQRIFDIITLGLVASVKL